MTDINLVEFTEFAKVKDIWNDILHDKNGLNEFLNRVVMNMDKLDDNNNNGYGIMLPNLSDIYVLVSTPDFPFEKLNSTHKSSIDLSVATKNFVLGYIWICPWKIENKGYIPYHFIQYIDSRISGLNIAKYMIDEYEGHREERLLFPYEVAGGAEKYWKQYFTEVYNIKNKNELIQMRIDYGINAGDVKWDELNSLF
tara:strand:+ start:4171 stop:4761 length:591 start_codon:yes stop_codon:yes gene_type:complete